MPAQRKPLVNLTSILKFGLDTKCPFLYLLDSVGLFFLRGEEKEGKDREERKEKKTVYKKIGKITI